MSDSFNRDDSFRNLYNLEYNNLNGEKTKPFLEQAELFLKNILAQYGYSYD